MGWDESETETYIDDKFPSPNITEDYTTFPVIGDIAAGYNHIAIESWDGDKVDVPNSYLKGYSPQDFFVLCVKGIDNNKIPNQKEHKYFAYVLS